MAKLIYPAVLERGAGQTFGAWFPDFPDCVAGGTSPEHAIEKAQAILSRALVELAEKDLPPPPATAFEKIRVPRNCDFVAFFAVTVEPPDPSERVNVYLPKSLIARADTRASELGMSRSSFFGFALTTTLSLGGRLPVTAFRQVALAAAGTATKPPKRRRKG